MQFAAEYITPHFPSSLLGKSQAISLLVGAEWMRLPLAQKGAKFAQEGLHVV